MHSTAEAMHRPLPGVTSSIDELLRNITLIAIIVIVSKYFLSNFFLWLTSRHILIRSPHVLLSIILGIRSSIAYPRLNRPSLPLHPSFLSILSSFSPSLPLHHLTLSSSPPYHPLYPRLLFTLAFSSRYLPLHPRLLFTLAYSSQSPPPSPHSHPRLLTIFTSFPSSSSSSHLHFPRLITILSYSLSSPIHHPRLESTSTPITTFDYPYYPITIQNHHF